MKFTLTFVAIFVAAFVFFSVFKAKERKGVAETAGRLVVPVLIALAAVGSAIILSTLPTIKVL